ncbi:MAG: hypothetical protein ABR534_16295, partial [Desulfotignum sp.]
MPQQMSVFYLPFNENWPVNLYAHFTPSYWAEEGFSPAYAEALEDAFKRFARHINENNWDRTVFQFYLNNKISYRENGNISGAPWLFDEPVNTRDFMALRWYGRLWRKAVDP